MRTRFERRVSWFPSQSRPLENTEHYFIIFHRHLQPIFGVSALARSFFPERSECSSSEVSNCGSRHLHTECQERTAYRRSRSTAAPPFITYSLADQGSRSLSGGDLKYSCHIHNLRVVVVNRSSLYERTVREGEELGGALFTKGIIALSVFQ